MRIHKHNSALIGQRNVIVWCRELRAEARGKKSSRTQVGENQRVAACSFARIQGIFDYWRVPSSVFQFVRRRPTSQGPLLLPRDQSFHQRPLSLLLPLLLVLSGLCLYSLVIPSAAQRCKCCCARCLREVRVFYLYVLRSIASQSAHTASFHSEPPSRFISFSSVELGVHHRLLLV